VIVETFPVGMLGCNCTILGDPASGEAIVIDGGDDVATIAARLDAHGLRPRYLLHTHAHFDHIGALGPLRDRVGGAGLLHPADRPLYALMRSQAALFGIGEGYRPVALDGDIGDGDAYVAGAITVRAIHTPGHTSLADILTSIRTRLLDYPDATRVVCGHGADTTIGTERTTNPFLTAAVR
jgi:hydroxyacylglutathione hydrolase